MLSIGYYHTYQNIDRGLIERLGPHGFVTLFYTSSSLINSINLSYIHRRIFIFIIGLLFMLIVSKYILIIISVEIIINIYITIVYRFCFPFEELN